MFNQQPKISTMDYFQEHRLSRKVNNEESLCDYSSFKDSKNYRHIVVELFLIDVNDQNLVSSKLVMLQ